MGYLGLTPITAQQSYLNIDDISGSFNGVTTSFALLVGGVAPVPFPVTNTCLISVNGVIQEPDDSGSAGFRISGGNIVFSSAPTSGHAFFGVILAGADYVNVGVNFPDGTLGAPSITFSSDTDTGLYRSASGQLSIASNGVAAGTFSSSAFLAVAGSAGTPSISQLSDTNTGIYFPGADQVAISTNGAGRLFIDSSGNVSVGTTTKASNTHFDLYSTSSYAQYIRFRDEAGAPGLIGYSHTDDSMQFYTSGLERFRLDSSGRLGLGTSSPGRRLHVSVSGTGNVATFESDSGPNLAFVGTEASGRTYLIGEGLTAAGLFQIYDNNASAARLTINSSGSVGIGTSSPSQLLTVKGTQSFEATNSTNAWLQYTYTDNSLRFNYNGAGADEIVITSGGNVGIGTTSPGGMLQVEGGVFGRSFEFHTSGISPTHGVTITSPSANNLAFRTSSNEAARFDSSGRLLVGTSSVTGISSQLTVVGGNVATFHNTANDQYSPAVYLSKARGTGSQIVSNGDGVGYLAFVGYDGTQPLRAAGIEAFVDGTPGANDMPGRLVFSTTADGASSPTERMKIDNQGHFYFNNPNTSSTPGLGNTNVGAAFESLGSSVGTAFFVSRSNGTPLFLNRNNDGTILEFNRSGNNVGSVQVTTTNTSYATSSDYRLKENVTKVTDGITRLQQLKPSRFNFIADPDKTVDGFIAHEVQAVVPEAIVGEKDAVDDEGNPVYQGIDQSKLVPLLTAALQEAIAKIETLEQRLSDAGIA